MFDQQTLMLGFLVFTVAGLVKGLIGLGLPTVSLALLSLFIDLRIAIALMVVPSTLTNVWQAVVGGQFWALTKRLLPMLVPAVIATWATATYVLTSVDGRLLSGIFGVLLTCHATISLLTPQIPPPGRWESALSPIVGGIAGAATGLTGSFVVPGVLYLQSLGLKRDELVQAMGIAFTAVLIALGGGLIQNKLMTADLGLWSLAGLVPAGMGMWAGQKLRKRIPEAQFRRLFFVALLVLGLYLAARGLL